MNFAEASQFRELVAEIKTLTARVADLERRADDQSKAHRVIADDNEKMRNTLSLKKANG